MGTNFIRYIYALREYVSPLTRHRVTGHLSLESDGYISGLYEWLVAAQRNWIYIVRHLIADIDQPRRPRGNDTKRPVSASQCFVLIGP